MGKFDQYAFSAQPSFNEGKVKSARKASDICETSGRTPTFALAQTPERPLQLPAFIAPSMRLGQLISSPD